MRARPLVRFLLRFRFLLLALVLAATGAATYFALPFRFNNSIQIWFREGDPTLQTYRSFLKRFEADEIVVVGVFAEDVFSMEGLAAVDRITRTCERSPHVHRVRSLTTLRVLDKQAFGLVRAVPLIRSLPRSSSEASAVRERTRGQPLVWDNFVGEGGSATAIVVELSPKTANFDNKVALVASLRALAETERKKGITVRLAGMAVLDDAFYRYSQKDFKTLGPVLGIAVLLITFAIFRRISAAILPLLVVLMAVLWCLGFQGVLGVSLNVLSSALIAVLLAVGVANSIHVITHYYQERAKGLAALAALEESLTNLLVPCVITTLTTIVGFLSLLLTDLAPLREFGWLSAFGVLASFLLSFTFLPALLPFVNPPASRKTGGLVGKVLDRLGRPGRRMQRTAFFVTVPLVAFALWRVTKIQVGPNPLNYFSESNPLRIDAERIDRALHGSVSFEILLSTPKGGLLEPATLRKIDRMERWLETQPGVARAFSIVDLWKDVERVRTDVPAIPRSPRLLWERMRSTEEGRRRLRRWMQEDASLGRVTVRVRLSESAKLLKLVPKIEETIRREFNDGGLHVEATGYVKLISNMSTYIIEGQIRSFSAAFLVITFLMFCVLRSVRLGLFAMIPNLIPIALGLAFMELAGISLNFGTVMIGCIALGLVVDDTIHFLVRLRAHAGEDMEEAVRKTMRDTGRPILVTSLALACGFGSLVLASFAPSTNFGVVTVAVVLFALAADLILLPAALLCVRPRIAPAEKASGTSRLKSSVPN